MDKDHVGTKKMNGKTTKEEMVDLVTTTIVFGGGSILIMVVGRAVAYVASALFGA